jgi:hypothetical protein
MTRCSGRHTTAETFSTTLHRDRTSTASPSETVNGFKSKFYKVLTMVYNSEHQQSFGLCPSSWFNYKTSTFRKMDILSSSGGGQLLSWDFFITLDTTTGPPDDERITIFLNVEVLHFIFLYIL